MEVKTGFRRTEAGEIPETWALKLLPEVCRFRSGKAHEQYVSERGKYICVNSKFISTEGHVRKYCTANFCPAKVGDVLIVMSDLPNGRALGKAYLVEADNLYAVNQRVCALTPRRDHSGYLFYVLDRSPYFLKFDDGVNQTHLLNHVFDKCPIPLPPDIGEQRAIAEALSDADALIESLEQLIAKKRDLKQAAMQQLLTGETRLPSFHQKWAKSCVGREFDVQLGKMLDAEKNRGIPKPYIGNRAVQWGRITVDDLPTVPMSSAELTLFRLCDGDLLVCEGGEVGRAAIWTSPIAECYFQKALHRLRPLRGFSSILMVSLLHYWSRQGLLANYVTQTSIAHLTREKLKQIPMDVPPVAEQSAIVEVLSDVDEGVTALEKRLEKACAIKQGMMQELLTGRIRLV